MGYGHPEAPGYARASDRRVHVAHHDDQAGCFARHDRGESLFDQRNLLGARQRANLERDFGARDAQLLEEHVRQARTVMLPGVHDRAAKPGASLHRVHERSDLHEIRSRTADVEYFSHGCFTGGEHPRARETSPASRLTSSSVRYACVGSVTSSLAQRSATGNAAFPNVPVNSGMAAIEVG
jgi:hypothetical protein